MDEIENDALTLLLLLDDSLFPQFLEWTFTQPGWTAAVLFLLEADAVRFKSNKTFLIKQDKIKLASIDHHVKAMYRNLGGKRCEEFSDVLQLLTNTKMLAYGRLCASGIPLPAAYSPLVEKVWTALLQCGKHVLSGSQWSSIRRSLVNPQFGVISRNSDIYEENESQIELSACKDTPGKTKLFVSLREVVWEPTYCKYFERFLQKEQTNLASLHCYKGVTRMLTQIDRLHVSWGRKNTFLNPRYAESSSIERRYTDSYEAFRILLKGMRSLQKHFFPGGTNFFSTFSLSTMVGGLRRAQTLSQPQTVNCAGLSESLRMEIAATLGLNASVRDAETEKVDVDYASSCSVILENLAFLLQREMESFLTVQFDTFAASSNDYAALVAFLRCEREHVKVSQYAHKMEFLQGTVRQQHILHWADSRSRGIAFATYDHDVVERERVGEITEEDFIAYKQRKSTFLSNADVPGSSCLEKLNSSRNVLGLRLDFNLPISTPLVLEKLLHTPHHVRAWATRDRLLMAHRDGLRNSGRVKFMRDRGLYAGDTILEGREKESESSSASSDYGDVTQLGPSLSFSFDEIAFARRAAEHSAKSNIVRGIGSDSSDPFTRLHDERMVMNLLTVKNSLVELDLDSLCVNSADINGDVQQILTALAMQLWIQSGLADEQKCTEDKAFVSFHAQSSEFEILQSVLFGNTNKPTQFLVRLSFSSSVDPEKSLMKVQLVFVVEPMDNAQSLSCSREITNAIAEHNAALGSLPLYPVDIFASLWFEVLSFRLSKQRECEKEKERLFFNYQTTPSLYDLYWQSFPMREEILSLSSTLFDTESELFVECSKDLVPAWPLSRIHGIIDFSLAELISRKVGVRETLQLVSLLLTNESLVIVSADKETLFSLNICLPRLLHPYNTHHEVRFCLTPVEFRATLGMRSAQECCKSKRERSLLAFVTAAAFQSVREASLGGGKRNDKEADIFVIDLDRGDAQTLYGRDDKNQFSLLDLRNRNIFVNNQNYDGESELERVVQRVQLVDSMLQRDLQRFPLVSEKNALHQKVHVASLVMLSNTAIENSFQRLHTELLLHALPDTIIHFPTCNAVGCDVQRLLAMLLGKSVKREQTLPGETVIPSLNEADIVDLSFDDFLAFYNDKTSRSMGSFSHAFYASFLAALAPAFVDLLKRHGRIIEEMMF